MRRLLTDQGSVVVGGLLVALLVALALLAPWIGGAGATALDVEHGLTELGAPLLPSQHGPLGTDPVGRDVWARLVSGAATSLSIAAAATAIALAIGLAIGLAAATAGGRLDGALMRLVDLVLSFPLLLLAILLAALLRGDGPATSAPLVITLGVVGWTTIARVIRGKAIALARGEMVIAARALGAGPLRIAVRYLLPNLAGLVVAVATLGFAQNLLAEVVLSYVGLGPAPPAPTWGRMLYEGRPYYRTAPHLVIAPGVAILVAVVGFNLLGEGLRDRLDPRARGAYR